MVMSPAATPSFFSSAGCRPTQALTDVEVEAGHDDADPQAGAVELGSISADVFEAGRAASIQFGLVA